MDKNSIQEDSMDFYGQDLARIHEAAFAGLARNAAAELTARLSRSEWCLPVAELGCGGGTFAGFLSEAGFQVIGFDISPSMVELARARVPHGCFHVRSLFDVSLPPVSAVAAIGEVMNYAFDDRGGLESLEAVFQRVYQTLEPGGLFMFDIATDERREAMPIQSFSTNEEWSVLVTTTFDGQFLSREITSFFRLEDLYRRSQEVHRLRLFDPYHVMKSLETVGFEVRRQNDYAGQPLLGGLEAFLATKPEHAEG